MIKLFTASDKIYSSNGDKVIQATKAKVHKSDNGDYYLTVETGLEYVNDLVEGNILVAPTPQGEQAFRISNPQKTRKKITVFAAVPLLFIILQNLHPCGSQHSSPLGYLHLQRYRIPLHHPRVRRIQPLL